MNTHLGDVHLFERSLRNMSNGFYRGKNNADDFVLIDAAETLALLLNRNRSIATRLWYATRPAVDLVPHEKALRALAARLKGIGDRSIVEKAADLLAAIKVNRAAPLRARIRQAAAGGVQ